MNRGTVIGALVAVGCWLLFLVSYGFFYGAHDEFFQCERYHLGSALIFGIELAAFLFPVTGIILVLGGVVGYFLQRRGNKY